MPWRGTSPGPLPAPPKGLDVAYPTVPAPRNSSEDITEQIGSDAEAQAPWPGSSGSITIGVSWHVSRELAIAREGGAPPVPGHSGRVGAGPIMPRTGYGDWFYRGLGLLYSD